VGAHAKAGETKPVRALGVRTPGALAHLCLFMNTYAGIDDSRRAGDNIKKMLRSRDAPRTFHAETACMGPTT